MTADELRRSLFEIGISQADLARLVNVSPRAISLWLGAERGIPGTVEAYLRLLRSLPVGQRQAEISRMQEGIKTMRDGIYGIDFSAQAGQGMGMLVFEGGRIYGADAGHAKYDGTYAANQKTGMTNVKIRVEMPANQPSVTGIVQPFDWMLDVTTEIDPSKEKGDVVVNSNIGRTLRARYEFIRPLPLM